MKLSSNCIACLVNGCAESIKDRTDEENKSLYMRDILRAILAAPDDQTSPCFHDAFRTVYEKYFGTYPEKDYTEINRSFNRLVMDQLPEIELLIRGSDDPILTAIKYSLAANYIDYTAVDVTEHGLAEMLSNAAMAPLDLTEYPNLLKELETARKIVFLHDNCGEIVLDKLLIQLIKEKYPQVHVVSCVRGGPAANDATMVDADYIRLAEVSEVIDSGCAITGTPLAMAKPEAVEEFRTADLIISKGQGNFETTFDNGLNIYYLFMCKCALFTHLFDMEKFSCVLVNNLRLSGLKEAHGLA